jgi:SAM-dependent methyltransferase
MADRNELEHDAFWHALEPVLFSDAHMTHAAEETDHAIRLLAIEPPARVLDLCCGIGRHSLELARRGFHVTAVDRTRLYLERARRRAQDDALDIEFVEGDMREFRREAAFDAAVNLFTSFGYFGDEEDNRRVLGNVHASLAPSGRFLMEMVGKEVVARIFQERSWEEGAGWILLQERRTVEEWAAMENRWILFRDRERHDFVFRHRLYSGAELSAMLRGCGFRTVDIYGHLDGAPYDHKAKRLVALACK